MSTEVTASAREQEYPLQIKLEPDSKWSGFYGDAFGKIRILIVRGISAPSTVVDKMYSVDVLIHTAVIVTKAPGMDFAFSVVGMYQMHESIAHVVELCSAW